MNQLLHRHCQYVARAGNAWLESSHYSRILSCIEDRRHQFIDNISSRTIQTCTNAEQNDTHNIAAVKQKLLLQHKSKLHALPRTFCFKAVHHFHVWHCVDGRHHDGLQTVFPGGVLQRCFISSTKVLNKRKKPTSGDKVDRASAVSDDEDGDEEKEIEDLLEDDQKYNEIYSEFYLRPAGGHRVFVLQPDAKYIPKGAKLTTAELQLEEACALVETLPDWHVVDKAIYSLKHKNKKQVYGKGSFASITHRVKKTPGISAVFVDVDMLNSVQLSELQNAWKVPVYDRYTIVLQIFMTHAKTKEAKLQVALAEIPYLRSRLKGMHSGSLDQQAGGLGSLGGAGESHLEMRRRLLKEREIKIRKALVKVKEQREKLRRERVKKEFPVVAVVGYTNAGKTSLIKAMTGEHDLKPRNQLFATLDVTAHAGFLPNNLKVLYMDTVGFISDIPTGLIESFSATLEDIGKADVIIHVRDVSHPDAEGQKANVLQTLGNLELPEDVRDNIIEVCNKADRISDEVPDSEQLYISATKGWGLPQLANTLAERIMANTGRLKKRLRIPMNGPQLSWLYKEAAVDSTLVDNNDSEYLMVDVVMTTASYAKYQSQFGKLKKKRHN